MKKRIIILEVSEGFQLVQVNLKINDINPKRIDVFVCGAYVTSIDSERYRLEYKRSFEEYDIFKFMKR